MNKRFLLGPLFLLSVILVACGTGGVTIEVQDDVAENVERAFPSEYYALNVMKDAAPQTEADLAGRNWIVCSHYSDASNNMMWLAQNTKSLDATNANLIGAPRSEEDEMLSACKKALDAEPESILVIDRDIKFDFSSQMVELKLK